MTDELSPEDFEILRGDDETSAVNQLRGDVGDDSKHEHEHDDVHARTEALLSRWRGAERLPRDRRSLLVMALVIVSALILIASRSAAPQPVRPFGAGAVPPLPVAPPDGTATSTWICPVVHSAQDKSLTSAIHIADVAGERLSGSVRFLASEGTAPGALPVALDPATDGRIEVPLSAAPLAAVVELVGGVGLVEQTVTSALGTSTTACASSASDKWYLAAGSTLRTTTFNLVIANPFAVDAVVDLSFANATTVVQPSELQGFVIPAGTVGVVPVTGAFQREELVSTSLVARRGRVVMGRLQSNDGTDGGRRGLFAGLASPSASPQWWFAGGTVEANVSEQLVLSNPSDTRAELEVVLYPSDGAQPSFSVPVTSLKAGGVVLVPITDAAGVPAGRHHLSVRSPNGVPIVAERLIDVTGERPSASNQLGSPRLASAWWFVAGEARQGSTTVITLANPSGVAVSVHLRRQIAGQLGELVPPTTVTLPPGGSLDVPLSEGTAPSLNSNMVIFVESDQPIVVERRWFRAEQGTSRSLGIPTRLSVAAPPPILDINGEPIDFSTSTTLARGTGS
jgi:Family of unknown function (DUF5719)